MLALEPLKKEKGRKKIDGRPIAFVQEKEAKKIVGLLKILDNEDYEIGDELIELPKHLEFKMFPETRPAMIDVIMLTGPQGCGKSTVAADYFRAFDEVFGGDETNKYIISADDVDDPAFSDIPHTRIVVDDTWIEAPPQMEDFINPEGRSCICFDDCEGVIGKKKVEALEGLIERCLTQGRKHLLHTIFISHLAANSKRTKNILNEHNNFIYFPKLGHSRNMTYCLQSHIGLERDMREYLKNSDWGRSIRIKTSSPQILIGEGRAAVYDHDDVSHALKKRSIIDKKRATMEAEEMLGIR